MQVVKVSTHDLHRDQIASEKGGMGGEGKRSELERDKKRNSPLSVLFSFI